MLASVQNTNSLSISNRKYNLLKDQTRLACSGFKSGPMKTIFGTSEIGNGYHMTTASCYNEMSTFQCRMLTFQDDAMYEFYDDHMSKCSNQEILTHKPNIDMSIILHEACCQ